MDKLKVPIREIALFGILGALTFGAKFAMSWLPNIEPVSLLVILLALSFVDNAQLQNISEVATIDDPAALEIIYDTQCDTKLQTPDNKMISIPKLVLKILRE